jgi:hypothetical protein
MPLAEITSVISSAKAAYDIAKGIASLKAEVDRNESISNILEILLSVQKEALALQEQYQELLYDRNELRKQLDAIKDWDSIRSQYSLMEISEGSYVYAPNQAHKSPTPRHWICANCFDNQKRKSILQLAQKRTDCFLYECPSCGTHVKDRNNKLPPTKPRIARMRF